jgi:hypothetical protein
MINRQNRKHMTDEIGEPAPGFELVDQTRSLVSLESLLGLNVRPRRGRDRSRHRLYAIPEGSSLDGGVPRKFVGHLTGHRDG